MKMSHVMMVHVGSKLDITEDKPKINFPEAELCTLTR